MFLISLDETGVFEKAVPQEEAGDNKRDDFPFFIIGGIVFIHEEDKNVGDERKRLKEWLENTCKDNGGTYPTDLHAEDSDDSDIKNKKYEIKTALRNSFQEFANATKNGKYMIYTIVGNEKSGPNCYRNKSLGNMISDESVSNRYEHMAYRAVENLLCYSPLSEAATPAGKIELELPTRWIEYSCGKYDETGHTLTKGKKNKDGILVTTRDSYRGMLLTIIPKSKRIQDKFDIKVQSIQYNKKNEDNQPFFYLADVVCSILRRIIKNEQYKKGADLTVGEAIQVIERWIGDKLGSESSIVWAYDEVEYRYRDAVDLYRAGDYFECLKTLYELKSGNQEIASFYQRKWVAPLIQRIERSSELSAVRYSLDKLEKFANSNFYSNQRAEYILTPIKKRLESITDMDLKDYGAALYRLYSIEMTVNNHFGKYDEAIKSFEKAYQYRQFASLDEVLELRNKKSVSLSDALQFDEALNFAKITYQIEEEMKTLRELIVEDEYRVHYGRTLSQIGQCYAFMGDSANAENNFTEALKKFQYSKTDYNRTLSYYLHLLIEMDEKEKYENFAYEYFGLDGKEKRQNLLTDINVIQWNPSEDKSFPFAMFVYIKAFVRFYIGTTNKAKKENVLQWINKNSHDIGNEHPAQLIYKYAAIIASSVKDPDRDKFIGLMDACVSKSEIIKRQVEQGHRAIEKFDRGESVFSSEDELKYMYR